MAEDIVTTSNELPEEDMFEVKRIRIEKLREMQASGNNPYDVGKYDRNCTAHVVRESFETLENTVVRIAGRMMSRRDMGKANFIDVMDGSGRIQVYVRINDVGEDVFNAYKKWDIGDFVGVEGLVFRTRRGEISIHAQKIELLSKSLLRGIRICCLAQF